MAEKQYKNYDERFLKEDPSSSGSRPVIEYILDSNELSDDIIPASDSEPAKLHLKKEDGSYAETQSDILDLFMKNGIIKITSQSRAAQMGTFKALVLAGDESFIAVDIGDGTLYACTTSVFEQLKQSQS